MNGGNQHQSRSRALLTVALVVMVALVVVLVVRSQSGRKTTVPTTTTQPPVRTFGPSYVVSGNQILANGKAFVPYGVTVFGLSYPDWEGHISSDEQQIAATASVWHGNTVRIQVSPTDLFSSQPYSETYLKAIEHEVGIARTDGLNVILSAQYERSGPIPMPESSTVSFWDLIAPLYAQDSGVWFDLFNEPRLPEGTGDSPQQWNIWEDGGSGYVGMQELVNVVRSKAPQNVILAEGLQKAETLAGLPGHELSGQNVVYAVHPYFIGAGYDSQSAWTANWGSLAATIPIVADEWGEYETTKPSCQPDAPTLVETFLSYLANRRIGLIAWSLAPNVLVRGTNLSDPTTFTPGVAFVCPGKTDTAAQKLSSTKNGQGAGEDVMAYFAEYSQPAPES